MEASEQYLIDYLREEFRRNPEVRIRKISEDHEPGISLKTASREYFFPIEWAHRQDFKSVTELVKEIRRGLKDEDGFTLVELMVVVAMIGVLSAIAIPNYERFVAKARQSEAKIALSSIFTAEKAFYLEFQTYTACLAQAGYAPVGAGSPNGPKRYYYVGSQSLGEHTCGPAGDKTCEAPSYDSGGNPVGTCGGADEQFPANATASGTAILFLPMPWLTTAKVAGSTYQFAAVGQITASGANDAWTINEQRVLANEQSGL